MGKPFQITSLEWRRDTSEKLRRAGLEAPNEIQLVQSLITLAHFLEEHRLTTRKLLVDGQLIGGTNFELWSTDLTDQGLAVIRAGFGKWENKGCPATDIRPLERAFKKVVGGGLL